MSQIETCVRPKSQGTKQQLLKVLKKFQNIMCFFLLIDNIINDMNIRCVNMNSLIKNFYFDNFILSRYIYFFNDFV